jgi:hypothetical protein
VFKNRKGLLINDFWLSERLISETPDQRFAPVYIEYEANTMKNEGDQLLWILSRDPEILI